ncbi:MAG: hypothetical protein RL189_2934 [Pseudomonadota bacterium]|jgi:hypothetical protein
MQNNTFDRFSIDSSANVAQEGAVVVDLQAFRLKKSMTGDKRRGVQDTFVLGDETLPRDNSLPSGRKEEELASRLERIKSSIQRINQLMSDLRDENQPNQTR